MLFRSPNRSKYLAITDKVIRQSRRIQRLLPDEESQVQSPATNMASTANSIVFARSPAGLNEELLDYSKSDDVKIYQSAIAPMTPLYDGEPGGLLTFLERLIIRADLSNWKNIIMTPDSGGVL